MRGKCLVALLVLACGIQQIWAAKKYEYEELERWVLDNGGMIKTKVDVSKNGIRGLYAKEAVKAGDYLATIPSSVILNAGSVHGDFMSPMMTLLREMHTPCTRFKPYLDIMPKKGEIINACNLPYEYLPLLQSSYWDGFIRGWQSYMDQALQGEVTRHMEYTFKEVVGNVNLTLDDVKHACALTSTRYVSTDSVRARLIMVPIYDMANHWHKCPHTISVYDNADELHIIAGKDVEAGEEICYPYGSMRDDYAVLHYGYLPEAQVPPRLLMIDRHDFNPEDHGKGVGEEDFSGTPEEVAAEVKRLQGILDQVEDFTDPLKHPPGKDTLYDLLISLRERRRVALKHEIGRLQASSAKTEL
eukprot:CAMPEP_0202890664 /NCGR_PEP_ID=MMETSP1392-20130828/995_1 /ASSEMBLY_ACC=CAM_ASM_000868 /TAXON_ID=225041 /ORGANISM="Chlamydomonas chlamydogama, Strain SAG 11-48b" /LENGTH=357 /DNA_ID=CAMNT_0049574279 /DNA_START=49 /DNA_END=1122 /DNA_ORIENTATION=+